MTQRDTSKPPPPKPDFDLDLLLLEYVLDAPERRTRRAETVAKRPRRWSFEQAAARNSHRRCKAPWYAAPDDDDEHVA